MDKVQLKKTLVAGVACALVAGGMITLTGCGSSSAAQVPVANSNTSMEVSSEAAVEEKIDYKVLVNRQNALPATWGEDLETVTIKNSQGNDVEVEKKAYDAYLELQEDLEKDGVKIDIDSALLSVADQQRIWDESIEQEGEDYTKTHVTEPGHSEYHTGLALDLYINVDGEDITDDEAMREHSEVWEKVQAKLADYGFILRYPDGQELITGYVYEPWHIRYINDKDAAKEIMDKKITFEEYLGVDAKAKEANEKFEAEKAAIDEERRAAEEAAAAEAAAAAAAAEAASYDYDNTYYDGGSSYSGGDGIYHAEYNEMYNDDGPSHTMPGWHDGYLETYYNASGHYLADTWTLDDEGFYHDENGRYVVGVDASHMEDMPYGTVVETGKGEGVVYDYGSGAEVHDFATNW